MFKDSAFIWYLTWGAVPAILSILLFWLTNSKASVSTKKAAEADDKKQEGVPGSLISKLTSNPLGNLVINITGAAALFFLLFIIMNPIKSGFFEKESSWKLKVAFKNEKGADIPYAKLLSIEPTPSVRYDTYDDKTVLVYLDNLREEKSNLKVNYALRVSFDGYETYTIPLCDSINEGIYCNRQRDTKFITTIKPIYLTARITDSIEASEQNNVVSVTEKPITPILDQKD